jgi:predicted GIY-YIG superfamily endonuclease
VGPAYNRAMVWHKRPWEHWTRAQQQAALAGSTPRADYLLTRKQAAVQWFVYIVECADGTFYTGITNDLERRVDEHNGGRGARYTRSRRPVVLRYHEFQPDRSRASIREYQIKAMPRQGKLTLIDQATDMSR